jgi:cytidylate kinase
MIITIDGPAGAGKSSAAQALATRLGFEFLDTGAMYRAVTLAALRSGIAVHDTEALARQLPALRIEMPPGRVVLNGEDISAAIRSPEVSQAASQIAENALVRSHLVQLQRAIAAGRNMVCEGRDQGTVAFPDAGCKFFLMADPAERARRRQRELQARGNPRTWEEVLHEQEVRDHRDAGREVGPMVPARDAVVIDGTHLTLEQVVERMEQAIKRRMDERKAEPADHD